MRAKMGMGLGFVVGYVLGSRAGRERYEQIVAATRRLWESARSRDLGASATRALRRVREQVSGSGGAFRMVDLTDRIEAFVGAARVEENPPIP